MFSSVFDPIDYHNRSQQDGPRGSAGYTWYNYKPTKGHLLFLAETGKSYAYGVGATRGAQGSVKYRKDEYIDWAKNRESKPGDPPEVAYTARTGELSHSRPPGRSTAANRGSMAATSSFTKWEPGYLQEVALTQEGEDKYNKNIVDQDPGGVDNGEGDAVQDFLDQLPGGPNDPNAPGAGGGTLDEIVNTAPPIAAPAPPIAAPAPPIAAPAPPAFIPEEGTLGEIIGSNPEEGISSSPGYTIDINGNILDANGNIIGTSSEAPVTPGYTIEDNIIYDLDGNPIGTGNATEIGDVIGGASDSNPVFDALTQEQITAAENAAEAVRLMDSGEGRYNAAMRKLGVVGRQGESYAPLILDQLRMAEMEAAQPQFAAFGFGQNPMLGGMPQIGVQGIQGNVGGQSALSALSNAGLNQLQVAQQPYNRIALPEIGLGGQPISQINNPTIFKASTSV